jgi:hypothetical protein
VAVAHASRRLKVGYSTDVACELYVGRLPGLRDEQVIQLEETELDRGTYVRVERMFL